MGAAIVEEITEAVPTGGELCKILGAKFLGILSIVKTKSHIKFPLIDEAFVVVGFAVLIFENTVKGFPYSPVDAL